MLGQYCVVVGGDVQCVGFDVQQQVFVLVLQVVVQGQCYVVYYQVVLQFVEQWGEFWVVGVDCCQQVGQCFGNVVGEGVVEWVVDCVGVEWVVWGWCLDFQLGFVGEGELDGFGVFVFLQEVVEGFFVVVGCGEYFVCWDVYVVLVVYVFVDFGLEGCFDDEGVFEVDEEWCVGWIVVVEGFQYVLFGGVVLDYCGQCYDVVVQGVVVLFWQVVFVLCWDVGVVVVDGEYFVEGQVIWCWCGDEVEFDLFQLFQQGFYGDVGLCVEQVEFVLGVDLYVGQVMVGFYQYDVVFVVFVVFQQQWGLVVIYVVWVYFEVVLLGLVDYCENFFVGVWGVVLEVVGGDFF